MSRLPGTYLNHNGHTGGGVLVGVLSNELARFSGFFQSLLGVMGYLPPGSGLGWSKGVNIPKACNRLAVQMLGGTYEWLWIMGDDHVFDRDIVARLLEHDVDIVVPHCMKRYPPWEPVVYDRVEGGYIHPQLPESGLTEVWAAGSAGMLIRRRVLEAVGEATLRDCLLCGGSGTDKVIGGDCSACGGSGEESVWFEGRNEDIGFCEKARAAGFRIYCDPQIPLGHITLATVQPTWADGQWHPEMVHSANVQVRYNRSNLPAAATSAMAEVEA